MGLFSRKKKVEIDCMSCEYRRSSLYAIIEKIEYKNKDNSFEIVFEDGIRKKFYVAAREKRRSRVHDFKITELIATKEVITLIEY